MSRYLRYAIIEDLDTVRHIPVGQVMGVKVSVTPITWLNPAVFFGVYVALSALGPHQSAAELARKGGVFAVGVVIGTLVHALGHILGGKLVHSPMDELLLTATRGVNIYHGDQTGLPGRVHLGRALGGPALNLLVAAALAVAYAAASRWLLPAPVTGLPAELMASIISINLNIGVLAILPLPSVDGQVIWREVLRSPPVRRMLGRAAADPRDA